MEKGAERSGKGYKKEWRKKWDKSGKGSGKRSGKKVMKGVGNDSFFFIYDLSSGRSICSYLAALMH